MDGSRLWSLDLEEFRGIKKIDKGPIKLAKFNVLVGRNNSGKTSLLEALALLPAPNSNMPLADRARSQVLADCHNGRSDFLIYGYSGTAIVTYKVGRVGLDTSQLHLKSDGQFSFKTKNENDIPQGTGHRIVNGTYEIRTATTSLSQVNTNYYSDDLYDSQLRRLTEESNWKLIEKGRSHNRVLKEVISPSLSEKFTEVLPHHLGNQMILQARKEYANGNSGWVRLSELGRGLQRVIVPLLLFEATNPSIALWDDLEAGMHPSLLENVVKWLFTKDWQTVISTHSIDVLSAMAEVPPKDAQIIILRKSQEDILSYEILDMDSAVDLIQSNQDPRKMANLLALR